MNSKFKLIITLQESYNYTSVNLIDRLKSACFTDLTANPKKTIAFQ
jgi:hypothetical protein